MTDPLSATSAAAGFLSLVIEITKSLINFYQAWKGREAEVARISEMLIFLLSQLETLENNQTPDLQPRIDNAIMKCKEIITELQEECKRFEKAAGSLRENIKSSGRRAAYPFKRGTLQNLEENITEIRDNLSFALDVIHLKDHQTMQRQISEVKQLIERINTLYADVRNWLQAPDASTAYNAACAKHQPGTGEWLLNSQQFNTWLTRRNSFLWINGFAGCGKSILLSHAVQHIFHRKQYDPSAGIAFFYFSFDDVSKQDESGMLRALLLQLSAQLPRGQGNFLEELHSKYRPNIPTTAILATYLEKIIRCFREVFIFLDALDESPRYQCRESVLATIELVTKWNVPGLHVLATSRDEVDIRESLTSISLEAMDTVNLSMQSHDVDKDIAEYVNCQLNDDPTLQKWKEHHSQIQTVLTQKGQGIFRYIECQLNTLRKCPRNKAHLEKCLHSLPRDLDSTYERLLCNIDESCIDDVRRILTLLCFSTRPLTVEELVDAHAVDLDKQAGLDRENRLLDFESIQEMCVGLIKVIKQEYPDYLNGNGKTPRLVRKVYIAHFSVQEYLESDRCKRQRAAMFEMQRARANAEISQICLLYLCSADLPIDRFRYLWNDFPLMEYAVNCWVCHYKSSTGAICTPKLNETILTCFHNQRLSFFLAPHLSWRMKESPAWKLYIEKEPRITSFWYACLTGFDWVVNNMMSIMLTTENPVFVLSTALRYASKGGHEELVRLLIDEGATINTQAVDGATAFGCAVAGGYENLVKLFLDNHADVNFQDEGGRTALHWAAETGHEPSVHLLLEKGTNVNIKDTRGLTALHYAVRNLHFQVVEKLLENNADVNMPSDIGTPLHHAAWGGSEGETQLLLNYHADVNAQGYYGTGIGFYGNPLHAAAYRGNMNVARKLLDHGADIKAQDNTAGCAIQAALSGIRRLLRNESFAGIGKRLRLALMLRDRTLAIDKNEEFNEILPVWLNAEFVTFDWINDEEKCEEKVQMLYSWLDPWES